MLRSQDVQVFVFLIIPVFVFLPNLWRLMGIITWCIFEYIFWTTTQYFTKLDQLIDIN